MVIALAAELLITSSFTGKRPSEWDGGKISPTLLFLPGEF
jgi:hypothetical protein